MIKCRCKCREEHFESVSHRTIRCLLQRNERCTRLCKFILTVIKWLTGLTVDADFDESSLLNDKWRDGIRQAR